MARQGMTFEELVSTDIGLVRVNNHLDQEISDRLNSREQRVQLRENREVDKMRWYSWREANGNVATEILPEDDSKFQVRH